MVKLENWGIVKVADGMTLIGEAYGHPFHEDGKFVHTSPIIEKVGNDTFKSMSGTIYKVGQVHPKFAEFLLSFLSDEEAKRIVEAPSFEAAEFYAQRFLDAAFAALGLDT